MTGLWHAGAHDDTPLDELVDVVGGKASGLVRAERAGLRVPAWCCIPIEAQADQDVRGSAPDEPFTDLPWWHDLQTWWSEQSRPPLAVRSSARGEDAAVAGASFAGVFASCLNIDSAEQLADAIRRCWASGTSERARQYAGARRLPPAALDMAVIVQRMVPATSAGVAFSHDPATGADDVVVAMTEGIAEDLVAGDARGRNFHVDRVTGSIAPECDDLGPRHRAMLREVVEITLAGEAALVGRPADVEWAAADDDVWLVQLRAASIPEPAPRAFDTTDTEEQFPGVAMPLTASVAIEFGSLAVAGLMERLPRVTARVTAATSPTVVHHGRLGMDFDRWYTLASACVPEVSAWRWLRARWGVGDPADLPARIPRAILLSLLTTLVEPLRRAPRIRSGRRSTSDELASHLLHLASLARRGAAVDLCEPWLEARRPPTAPTPFQPPDPAVRALRRVASRLDRHGEDHSATRRAVQRFVHHFGWLSPEGLHLEQPRLSEDTATVLTMARATASAPPRQRRQPLRRPDLASIVRKRRELFRRRRAGAFADLRDLARHAGDELASRGLLADTSEVFLLGMRELQDALDGHASATTLRRVVARRRAHLRRAQSSPRDAGVRAPEPSPRVRGDARTGVGCVPGTVEATATVGEQPNADTAAVGGVLVCERLTPDSALWLGAHSALVVERSNPLAHAVIVARELGIPTVVQVAEATTAISAGARIRVDGAAGTVTILD